MNDEEVLGEVMLAEAGTEKEPEEPEEQGQEQQQKKKTSRKLIAAIIAICGVLVIGLGTLIWLQVSKGSPESDDTEVAQEEPEPSVFAAKVPTVSFYDERQAITVEESQNEGWLAENGVELVAIEDLDVTRKVLMIGDEYPLEKLLDNDEIFTYTQTGVTALSRSMIRRLNQLDGDAGYFSEKIGETLRKADITHISNETSFTDKCKFVNSSVMSLCSPWAMLTAITDSGIDVVEMTGNHNNDYGAAANTDTINKYHELGIATVGGGLNTEEAKKPYSMEMKGAHVVQLAYNQADGAGSAALAGASREGANKFSYNQARADIEAAKAEGAFVIVNIQYWECWSYPERGTEMPACDYPISGQQKLFRDIAAMGADMVVGSSAHQPQTFEIYNGVPIYYGLGNLWFDQSGWPGTTRGLILTHYFYKGKLISSRIQPTVYGTELQVRLMENANAESFLKRLGQARPSDADKLGPQTIQEVVNGWAEGKDVGVIVYDLDSEQTVAEVNQNKKYFSASLYKMAVVTAGYLAVQSGQDASAILTNGQTWSECLDAAIRTSDSPCAEALWAKIGQDKATTSMSASDTIRELRRIWGGEGGAGLSAENRSKYLDSMLNQQELYRRGLPSGFSGDVKVYNKVGWNGNQEWHDAAIVTIGGKNYAIAVMTKGIAPNAMGWSGVKELGALLEKAWQNA